MDGSAMPPDRPTRSLGIQTDMLFHRFDGIVIERNGFTVIRTPANPGFFFGNLLIFRAAPTLVDATKWAALFASEFQDDPRIRHTTLIWDTEDQGDITGFVNSGFTVETALVLTARSVRPPPKPNRDIDIHTITTDDEWRAVVECQMLSPSVDQDPTDYRLFKTRQIERYRTMAEQGHGTWFGAFHHGKLVADLGLFRDGTIGRFQQVETHPDYRRQGICGTLVHKVACLGLETMGLSDLVMVADEAYHAARIYQQVGFVVRERHHAAFRSGTASLGFLP
jgi:GNAT superfamily N-acetyltransferase